VENFYTILQQILFRKPCARFHQNRPNFVEDITKNNLVSFFPDTLYSFSGFSDCESLCIRLTVTWVQQISLFTFINIKKTSI